MALIILWVTVAGLLTYGALRAAARADALEQSTDNKALSTEEESGE